MIRKSHPRPLISVVWILLSLAASAALAAPLCRGSVDVEANAVWRGSAAPPEQTLLWHLPMAGIATVEIVPEIASANFEPAGIEIRSGACGAPGMDVLVIERSATHLMFAVRTAGVLHLRAFPKERRTVAGVSPQAPRFRLATRLIPAEVVEELVEVEPSGLRTVRTSFFATDDHVEPEDVDPDPAGLRLEEGELLVSFLTLQAPSVLAMEPEKVEPEDVDPDPAGFTVYGAGAAAGW